jgi:hypothetical protein
LRAFICVVARLAYATPNDIIRRIERYSGVKLAQAFAIPDLDREAKWHCKYGRQNGIHVSPTFMVDGLVQPEQWRPNPRLGGAPIGSLTPRLVQEARSAIAWLYRLFAERGNQTSPSGKNLPPSMPVPQPPARPSPQNLSREIVAARLRHRAAACRAAAPASARTSFSGIDDGDGLDLDHEIGSGETGNADGRAGRGLHPR